MTGERPHLRIFDVAPHPPDNLDRHTLPVLAVEARKHGPKRAAVKLALDVEALGDAPDIARNVPLLSSAWSQSAACI